MKTQYFNFKTHKKRYHPETDVAEIRQLTDAGFTFIPEKNGRFRDKLLIQGTPRKHLGSVELFQNLVDEYGEVVLSKDETTGEYWVEIYNLNKK